MWHKLNFKRSDKCIAYQTLPYVTNGETFENLTKTINSKCQLQRGMINLNCPVDLPQHETFKIISNKSSKSTQQYTLLYKYIFIESITE